MSEINLITIATIALLGGFGHCLGMCGGIVIAYSSHKLTNKTKSYQFLAHFFYNIGRVTTYAFIGLVFGFLGSMIALNNTINSLLFLIAGTIMILAGFSLLGWFNFLAKFEHSLSSTNWYKNSFSTLIKSSKLSSFYLLGILNGFLPCGFVYFFAITATSTADPLLGMLVMTIFGLSTIPALFALGSFVGLLQKTHIRTLFVKIAAILVILYGLNTLHTSYYFATDPNASLQNCH